MNGTATVTAAQVAHALGMSESTVYEWVRQDRIPNVGLGRAVRIPRTWLDRWLAAAGEPVVVSTDLQVSGTFT